MSVLRGYQSGTTWVAPEELGTIYPPPQWSHGYISEWETVKLSRGVKIMQSHLAIIRWAEVERTLALFSCL